jgi:imidazolonepropionase
MLLHSASQLLTLAGGPQRGDALGNLTIIPDGAVLIENGRIEAAGTTSELRGMYPEEELIDCSGKVVMPGFVDPHTHAIWVGDRAAEFEMRLEGKTYLEILDEGGGILSSVRAARAASLEQMVAETRPRLHNMFAHGTTTAEVKTGYGLQTETELRMMQALLVLDMQEKIDIVPTFLGAHAIPQEYYGRSGEYTDMVKSKMLPELKVWWQEHAAQRALPFVDVFCETGAFSLEESRAILQTAKELGFPIKIHSDEFDSLGGTVMAAELGAISADHLVASTPGDIKALCQSDTAAVALPCTPFGLSENHYTPAKEILKAGGLLAIATDLNPGTAWCESMQFAIALACRYMGLTPAQAIAASTINAAAAIDRSQQIGSIEPGKQADMLVLSVPDYRHLGYRFGVNLVGNVIKKGQIYPQSSYL